MLLDPNATDERRDAFAHFMAHDVPDFAGWCAETRALLPALYPADVRLVSSQDELRAQLHEADAVIVESMIMGADEIALAPHLKAVQKYGTITRNIDAAACAARGIAVLTLRRRANIACAEHAMGLMLTLVRRLHQIVGRISVKQLEAAGFQPTTFDKRHTPYSGWGRVSGFRLLHETTLGIIGMGEIGRELSVRADAFGMHVNYFQRTPLTPAEENRFHATYKDRKSTRLNSSHIPLSRMPSSA